MRESQLCPDPRQRARWWMYRSSTTPPASEDPALVAYRAEHVTDAIPAVPAHINTAYWENRDPWVLRPDDDSDDEAEELVVLSDEVEEEPIMHVLAPIIDAVEGDKNRPIDVEKLPEVADLLEVIVIKQEMEEDVAVPGKKKRDAEKKTAVWRSERLKMLKKEE
ncbi:hypothetical protein ZWY2020_024083 [Hordeum vulgare]|nr:hypothetical protein ZWY2020_024083 [Hordeum vulgare]